MNGTHLSLIQLTESEKYLSLIKRPYLRSSMLGAVRSILGGICYYYFLLSYECYLLSFLIGDVVGIFVIKLNLNINNF